MSIPKEPRQLMINLMYLVLTALLALNVSAEVMNAFLAIDKSLDMTNANTGKALDATQASLAELLKEDAKAKYRPLLPAIDEIREEVNSFSDYVGNLKETLIDQSGDKNGTVDDGDYIIKDGERYKLKGLKNKDVTTKMLVNDGIGDELEQKVRDTREKLLASYTKVLTENGKTFGLKEEEIKSRIDNFTNSLTLNVTDEWKESKDKTSWSDFKFRQMPVAAVLPVMTQIVTDARNAESSAVNQLAELSGGRVIEFNQFFPVLNAKKGYVIKGDKFEAEVSVGTYSDQINPADVMITINGQQKRPNKDGKVVFTETASQLGKRKLSLTATVNNPLTGERSTGNSEFTYEVGESSVTVSADKMNVFYMGVPNPISVSAAGISSNELKVGMSGAGGGTIKRVKDNQYEVRVTTPTRIDEFSFVTVAGGGMNKKAPFRVKRIPDPVARLGKSAGGNMANGEFRAQRGVGAFLDNFDFDAKCLVSGFELIRVPKRQDPIRHINKGARYDDKGKNLVNAAKPGDIYFFSNVRAKCPGDTAGRKINDLVFNIK